MIRIAIVFFLIIGSHLKAQDSKDSLRLFFGSEFEKSNFYQLTQNEDDKNFVEALLAIDSTITEDKSKEISNELDGFLDGLKQKAGSYNPKKQVKYIFNRIHDRFFRKYELDAYFSDIFGSATYNCVTGTALYAYAFDHLNVPYQIKETPTHVFIVAYPLQHNIYVETTLPGKAGSYAPSDFIIKKAVDNLVEMKVLTSEHVGSVGYNKAYNDYFYGDGNISKKDLVGIQYYNKGIYFLNKADYEAAYKNMSKSKAIYQNEKLKIVNEGILALLLDKVDFADINNFTWLIEYANNVEDADYSKYKLYSILSKKSWSDAELEKMEELLSTIDDEPERNVLLETFYSHLAEQAHKFQRTKKALVYANKVYELNSDNIDAKNYIATFEIDRLARKNLTASRLDELTALTTKYPFITEFGIYERYQVYLYAFLVSHSYDNNRVSEGAGYLEVLESILETDEESGLDFNQSSIGLAYGSVGAYYYRKGQITNAKKFLNRGLEFSPDNENIQRKLRLIKNSN